MKSPLTTKLNILVLLLLMIILYALTISNVNAAVLVSEFNDGKSSLEVDGNAAIRYAYWDWFKPNQTATDNKYDYFFTRTRFGFLLSTPQINIYAQGQNVQMWGLPDDALAPPPGGPLGIGAIYYLHGGNVNYHSTILRQAYIDFTPDFAQGLTVRLGRFDYVDALEVTYKNPKVMWLKKIRLAERLIGPFGWSSFCRSFDGMQFSYDWNAFNLNSILTHPTQGGFENNANKTINGIDLFTLTGTIKYDKWIPNTESRIFYIYYKDDRNVTGVVDNTGTSVLKKGGIKINTFGTHFLKTVSVKQGIFDGILWAAYQTGNWGALKHRAWAWDIEGGFQFTNVFMRPWFRVGYFMSSGDSDPTDGKHETFYQLLPTARKYALFPFYNMMNNEDLFFQVILKPAREMAIRADLHSLKLTQKNDMWYMGAGPTRENGTIFGYIARPSFGDNKLATVFEVTTMYNFSKYISCTLYWGHAFGGDVIKNIYESDKDGNYFFMEMNIKF